MARIEIQINDDGIATLKVDGERISLVRGFNLRYDQQIGADLKVEFIKLLPAAGDDLHQVINQYKEKLRKIPFVEVFQRTTTINMPGTKTNLPEPDKE